MYLGMHACVFRNAAAGSVALPVSRSAPDVAAVAAALSPAALLPSPRENAQWALFLTAACFETAQPPFLLGCCLLFNIAQ